MIEFILACAMMTGNVSDIPKQQVALVSVVQEAEVDQELVRAFKISINQWIQTEKSKRFFQRDFRKIRLLTRALNDDALMEHLASRYEAEIKNSISGQEEGRFQEIIQWIIDNQDEIIRFILMIIDLFS